MKSFVRKDVEITKVCTETQNMLTSEAMHRLKETVKCRKA